MEKEVRRVEMIVWRRVRSRGGRVPLGGPRVALSFADESAFEAEEAASFGGAPCGMSPLSSSRLTFFSGGSSVSADSRFVAGDSSFLILGGTGPGRGIDGKGKSLYTI